MCFNWFVFAQRVCVYVCICVIRCCTECKVWCVVICLCLHSEYVFQLYRAALIEQCDVFLLVCICASNVRLNYTVLYLLDSVLCFIVCVFTASVFFYYTVLHWVFVMIYCYWFLFVKHVFCFILMCCTGWAVWWVVIILCYYSVCVCLLRGAALSRGCDGLLLVFVDTNFVWLCFTLYWVDFPFCCNLLYINVNIE